MTPTKGAPNAVTAADLSWTSIARQGPPSASNALACAAIYATRDDVAATVIQAQALSLADTQSQLRALRDVLSEALTQLNRAVREVRRLRERLREVLDAQRVERRRKGA